ncbi:unnamed protein product [Symbiodinium natans]|uniref:Uncharacterized protein n=1 Tax=Symbiodinium natans TaxID=878477 RepID=A0A812RIU8_9DINO|nr:unnamed protein product [Symbiodinium natans]
MAFLASAPALAQAFVAPLAQPELHRGPAGGPKPVRATATGCVGSALPWCLAAAAASFSLSRSSRTAMRGLKDRVKKDFSVKSAMIRRLGKWRLMKEFDMRKQIRENPDMAKRCGKSQEALIEDFNKAANYLTTTLGLEDQSAEICISKVSTGLNMQFLGKPNIPSNEDMAQVMDWLVENLAVAREDGSLKRVVEQYPFMLGRSIDDLEESQNFCPEDIDFKVAVADDPALIDKTYNCQGICASQCVSCWYNG